MNPSGPRFRSPAEVRAIPNATWEAWVRNPETFRMQDFAPRDDVWHTALRIIRATERRMAAKR